MSGAETSFITARLLMPNYLVQGQDNDLSCPLWQNGAIVAVTEAGSTVSVYDASGTVVVDAAAVTVDDDGIPTYTLAAALVPTTRSRGMGWRVEWSLVVNGKTKVVRNAAGLVKAAFFPVVADPDLFRREGALDPNGAAPISALTDFQDFIDEAVVTIHGRLAGKGSIWNLVMEPSALREPLLLLTLALVFEHLRTTLNETWKEKADDYRAQFKDAWDGLVFEYDATDAGASDGRRKRAGNPSVWLGGFD
jgi:hypothetical protein